jgi:hypothetical protein
VIANQIAGALGAGAGGGGGSFESIATVSGTGSSGTITFNSIPSTYKHLQIRGIANSLTGAANGNLRLNGAAGSVYSWHQLRGNGSAASATGGATATQINTIISDGGFTNGASPFIIDFIDYADTSKYKTVRSFLGYETNSAGNVYLASGLYQSTSSISSISIINNSSDFYTTSSTFALYGIKG